MLAPLLGGRRVRRLGRFVPGLRAGRVDDPGDVAAAGEHVTDIPAHQAGRLVGGGPGHDVVVDGTDHVDVVLDVAEGQLLSLDLHDTAGQFVAQVQRAQVEGVHGGGHAGVVAVPGEDVKGRRVLAQQPVGHHVVEDQVVGAQRVERGGHLPALQDALLLHLPFQPGHRAFVGERAEHARLAVVEQGVEQRDRAEPVVTGARQVGGEHPGERPAEAQPDDVDLRRPGDVGDDVQRGARAVDEVVVQGDVAHARARVAVGDREDRALVGDGPLQEAAAGGQVHDVVLVDPWRAGQHRDRPDLGSLRGVLDQFHQVVPEDHLAGGGGHVPADLEWPGVHLPRHPLVVAQVVKEVPGTGHDACPARLERALERRRVGGEVVRRGERREHQVGH